jgi:hypothetical protein
MPPPLSDSQLERAAQITSNPPIPPPQENKKDQAVEEEKKKASDSLIKAKEKIEQIETLSEKANAKDYHELMFVYEFRYISVFVLFKFVFVFVVENC